MFSVNDFNTILTAGDATYVQIQELNKLLECGAIEINPEKLEEYKRNTRIIKLK